MAQIYDFARIVFLKLLEGLLRLGLSVMEGWGIHENQVTFKGCAVLRKIFFDFLG